MQKILKDLTTMCWIAIVAGAGGTAICLYLRFKTGGPSVPILMWVTWFAVGLIGYRVRQGLANLNGRLDKLERPK